MMVVDVVAVIVDVVVVDVVDVDVVARSLNCYHPPVSLVGRFRLGGQVLLGIENLSLAPRWAETISTTKALVTQ